MATDKSTKLTNRSAMPRVLNHRERGVVKVVWDTVAVTDNTDGDVAAVCCRVPVDATIHFVHGAFDDFGGTTAVVDLGFYKQDNPPIGTTFTAVDDDAIANDIDVSGAAVSRTDYRFSAANINAINKKAWEYAGLSAKPDYADLYIFATFDVDSEQAGDLSLTVLYSE